MANFAANFVNTDTRANQGSLVYTGARGEQLTGSQAIGETSAVKKYALGARLRAQDPVLGEAEFVYAQGVVNTVAGMAAVLNGDGTTTLAVTGSKGLIGIAMSANGANQYGWYCIFGSAVAKANAGVVAGAPAFATAAAGLVDDAVVAGNLLTGASFATADAGIPAGQALALAAGFAILRVAYSTIITAV